MVEAGPEEVVYEKRVWYRQFKRENLFVEYHISRQKDFMCF
jgi:(2Fe-2S) ferredoxin